MEITEVRVALIQQQASKLRAYCSMALDGCFVIRDLKIIDGHNGLFVAMPSRKVCRRCAGCSGKNHLRAKFCNECGVKLEENPSVEVDPETGRPKLHVDVAHPITQAGRDLVTQGVLAAYRAELEASGQPGYMLRREEDT